MTTMTTTTRTLVLIIAALAVAAAFVQPQSSSSRSPVSNGGQQQQQQHQTPSVLFGLLDQVGKFFDDLGVVAPTTDTEFMMDPNSGVQTDNAESKQKKAGRVVRTAARSYDKAASTPASRLYTTRKTSLPSVSISSAAGVDGDYNHYRTAALSSTPDRAVSILTTDAMKFLRSLHPTSQEGDLGENLLVDGVAFRDLAVGDKVLIGDGDASVGGGVLLQITERIVPCANLCKLPYINNEKLKPNQRIQQCQTLIEKLDMFDGLRGWYAKVLQPGKVSVGSAVRMMA